MKHSNRLTPDVPLARALGHLLAPVGSAPLTGELSRELLPSSRPVYRFHFNGNGQGAVGKFYRACPPAGPQDQGLVQEYHNYLLAAALGLGNGRRVLPRLLGRRPDLGLGLLLEAIPGPDLDCLIRDACLSGEMTTLFQGLESLAELLAFFHSRPLPEAPTSGLEALGYMDKLLWQLSSARLLTAEDEAEIAAEKTEWAIILTKNPDRQVLVHGDATPTNFLFSDDGGRDRPPYGRVVAIDLERLRPADRLWDLSWVAGELKHAWAWRTGQPVAAEAAIGHFFRAYLAAAPGARDLEERLYRLNPFYMALAELRIARNAYLSWDHRRWLVAEARRCLSCGRRT
jgi:aminoglycoside phosphotransferase